MKRYILILVALLVLGGGAAGLYFVAADGGAPGETGAAGDAAEPASNAAESTDPDEDEEQTAVPVRVVEVAVGEISTYLTSTANLVPEDEVEVLAEAEGRVTRLLVEEGDPVTRGQLLATLLRDEAEIAHNKARLKADDARSAFERASRMIDEQLISQEEYDKVRVDHRIAEQELSEARWRLEKTEIRAPFDGRLTWRNVTLGQHIRPGDALFRVTDFDPLIARIYLPERDVLSLEEGRGVDLTLNADESIKFRGRISQISPVVDVDTGTVKVTVAAIDPPETVRPGGFITVDIVRETRSDTLVLPREAVLRELKKAHVFVARDEIAERRAVELGLEENGNLEIVSGLEAGENVIVAGQGGLKDGARIKILEGEDEALQALGDDDKPRRRVG